MCVFYRLLNGFNDSEAWSILAWGLQRGWARGPFTVLSPRRAITSHLVSRSRHHTALNTDLTILLALAARDSGSDFNFQLSDASHVMWMTKDDLRGIRIKSFWCNLNNIVFRCSLRSDSDPGPVTWVILSSYHFTPFPVLLMFIGFVL